MTRWQFSSHLNCWQVSQMNWVQDPIQRPKPDKSHPLDETRHFVGLHRPLDASLHVTSALAADEACWCASFWPVCWQDAQWSTCSAPGPVRHMTMPYLRLAFQMIETRLCLSSPHMVLFGRRSILNQALLTWKLNDMQESTQHLLLLNPLLFYGYPNRPLLQIFTTCSILLPNCSVIYHQMSHGARLISFYHHANLSSVLWRDDHLMVWFSWLSFYPHDYCQKMPIASEKIGTSQTWALSFPEAPVTRLPRALSDPKAQVIC